MLFASLKEGWGIGAMEAQSYGCPVVAYDVPGIRDSVINGITGILVEKRNVRELGKALIDLISDKNRLNKMSKEAYTNSLNYGWELCYEDFVREMRSINN